MSKKSKNKSKKKKLEWSKIIALLTILFGFLIVQECLFIMYLAVKDGFAYTAAWLTAGVGVGEAVIIAGAKYYFGLAISDHKDGGITMEIARANNFYKSDGETGI